MTGSRALRLPAPDALSEFEDFGVQTAEPPSGVADLARIDDLPSILSGLLVMVAAATLSHTCRPGCQRTVNSVFIPRVK